jgi:hypothetical protein
MLSFHLLPAVTERSCIAMAYFICQPQPHNMALYASLCAACLASSSPDALISDNVATPPTAVADAPASAADTQTGDPTAPTAAAAAAGPGDAGCGDSTALWEGPPPPVSPIVPGAALHSGGVGGLLLYQPGLGVGEFQAWHVTAQPGQKAIDMVSCCCAFGQVWKLCRGMLVAALVSIVLQYKSMQACVHTR